MSYILLHELGHILNIGQKEVPFWTYDEVTDKDINESKFTKMSWRRKGESPFSLFDKAFPLRKATKYYSRAPRIPNSNMLELYRGLRKTNFPTGYAMNNPWDDFAECFVNYIHTQIYKRPFEIIIKKKGKVVEKYSHCWNEARCQKKRQFIEELIL